MKQLKMILITLSVLTTPTTFAGPNIGGGWGPSTTRDMEFRGLEIPEGSKTVCDIADGKSNFAKSLTISLRNQPVGEADEMFLKYAMLPVEIQFQFQTQKSTGNYKLSCRASANQYFGGALHGKGNLAVECKSIETDSLSVSVSCEDFYDKKSENGTIRLTSPKCDIGVVEDRNLVVHAIVNTEYSSFNCRNVQD